MNDVSLTIIALLYGEFMRACLVVCIIQVWELLDRFRAWWTRGPEPLGTIDLNIWYKGQCNVNE